MKDVTEDEEGKSMNEKEKGNILNVKGNKRR